MTLRLTYDLGC